MVFSPMTMSNHGGEHSTSMSGFLTLYEAIDINNAEEDAHKILAHVRKQWKKEDIKFKSSGVGFINLVLTAYVGDLSDAVVLRIFTGKFAILCDKDRERTITRLIHELAIFPKLHCFFTNGFCYEFVEGQNFHWNDFSELDNIKIAKANVRELAKLHCDRTRDLAIDKYKISTVNYIENHFDRIMTFYPETVIIEDPGAIELLATIVPSKDELYGEMAKVWKMVQDMNLRLCLCHNDANPTNFIYNKKTDQTTLVDYDSGAFGYPEYDLTVFLSSMNRGVVPSTPDSPRNQPQYWKDVLREYLHSRHDLDGAGPVTDRDVDIIYTKVRKMTLFFSLVYTLLTIIDAGFEVLPFGTPTMFLRLGEEHYNGYYLKNRDELLALKIPE